VRRLLVILVSVAVVLVSGCWYGDPQAAAYVVNDGREAVFVVLDVTDNYGSRLIDAYLVPSKGEGFMVNGPGTDSGQTTVFRATDCTTLGEQTVQFGLLLVTVPATGGPSIQTGVSLYGRPGAQLSAMSSRPCSN
jgi:hypothetical protein